MRDRPRAVLSLLAAGLAVVAACSTATTSGTSGTTVSPTSSASETTARSDRGDGGTATTRRSPGTTGRTGTTGAPPGTLSPSRRDTLLSTVLTPDDLDAAWTVSRKPRIRQLSIAGDTENLLFSDEDCPGLRATVPALADGFTYPAANTTLSRTDGGTEAEIELEQNVVLLPDEDAASQIIDLARSDEYLDCGRRNVEDRGGTIERRAVDGVGDEATAVRITSTGRSGDLVLVRVGSTLVALAYTTTGEDTLSSADVTTAVQKASNALG